MKARQGHVTALRQRLAQSPCNHGQAEAFLQSRNMSQKEARKLIAEDEGKGWTSEQVKGRGSPVLLHFREGGDEGIPS